MQVQSDELVGLLESFDKKGREGDRQFFLQAFNDVIERLRSRYVRSSACPRSLHGG